jgi:hypothetical protein
VLLGPPKNRKMAMTMSSELVLPTVGDGSGIEPDRRLHPEELQLALRNKALPLEGLSYDVPPTGLHYTLIHYDIPVVNVTTWHLEVGGRYRGGSHSLSRNCNSGPCRCYV